jgi:hypothetical protein
MMGRFHGWSTQNMDDTVAQEIIGEYYGKPVNASFAELEMAALVLGHAAGTLDHEHERLYAALVAAGEIKEPTPVSARTEDT